MKGKLYGIGIGPGDPELITVKGARILGEAHVAAIPRSGEDRESVAMEIAGRYLRPGAEIMELTFPMVRDQEEKRRSRERNALMILEKLRQGKTVVFITLGDPMLYSTYIYLAEHLRESGVDMETVPGITSFCAMAARSNRPLANGKESLLIVPVDKKSDLAGMMESADNVVFMKVSSDNERLASLLMDRKDQWDITIATKCGAPDESWSRDPGDLAGEVHYLTTVMAKRKNEKISGE